MHPREEKTVVLVKPDGVKRGLIGEIIKRFEDRGLKIIALKMAYISRKQANYHYPNDNEFLKIVGEKTLRDHEHYEVDVVKVFGTKDPVEIGKQLRVWMLDFLISGPIVAMIIQGIHAIPMVRKIVGNTLPSVAEMGTIRGDFSVDSAILGNMQKRAIHNLVHASGNQKEAEHELKLWFTPKEIYSYKRSDEDIMF